MINILHIYIVDFIHLQMFIIHVLIVVFFISVFESD